MAKYGNYGAIPFKASASFPIPEFDGPYSYAWSFDGGGTATGQYATHVYSSTGNKTTTCAVTNASTTEIVNGTITDEIYPAGWISLGAIPPRQFIGSLFIPLPNGNVLIAGGYVNPSLRTVYEKSCYEFDGSTYTRVGDMITGRCTGYGGQLFSGSYRTANYSNTGALLPSGKILVCGGVYDYADTNKTELYDPVSRTWSATGNLPTLIGSNPCSYVPLLSGDVLLFAYEKGVSKYDYNAGTWSSYAAMSALDAPLSVNAINLGNDSILVATDLSGSLDLGVLNNDKTTTTIASTGFANNMYYGNHLQMVKVGNYVYIGCPNTNGNTLCKYTITTGAFTVLNNWVPAGKLILLNDRYLSDGGVTVYDTATDSVGAGTFNHVTTPGTGGSAYRENTVPFLNGVLSVCHGSDGLSSPELFYY